MHYLKGYKTNPQVRMLHNVKAVQSRMGWTEREVHKAISDAKAGIAYEFCKTCESWISLDCIAVHVQIPPAR